MDIGIECQRTASEVGDLRYCKDQIMLANQIAVLIVKPSNRVQNANATPWNINNIVGRISQNGWLPQGVKVFAGGDILLEKLMDHYAQPFYDSRVKDVGTRLTSSERQELKLIWGEEASSYPIYHPVQIVESGITDLATIASIWHSGRGINNQLLDSGNSSGINTVTRDKAAQYGKRRLLLVKDHPDLPGERPFFIVNGFTAELMIKFSRQGERIVVMTFGQYDLQFDIDYLREYVIGNTNPHMARPGSIRFDALQSEQYTGMYPIMSLDEVGIENNIVHFSDSLAEAHRELGIWMPEIMWYPSSGPFAPDISFATWKRIRKDYLARGIESGLASNTSANGDTLRKWSTLPAPTGPVQASVNMMAGGSGGRFFGYELPEHLRNKLYAPIVTIGDRTYSFLDLQLARLTEFEYVKQINIIAAESTVKPIQAVLQELKERAGQLMSSVKATEVLQRIGIPRIIPTAQDLFAEPKFSKYCIAHGSDAWWQAQRSSHNAGSILHENDAMARKAPGTLSVFLNYIHHCLKKDLLQGIEVAFFHIGEDAAAIPDARYLSYAKSNNAVVYIGVVKSDKFQAGGHLVSRLGRLQLYETTDKEGLTPPFYINTCRMAINLSHLAQYLAGDVANFLEFDENQIRQVVDERIVNPLMPRFEIKPLHNYELWAGQFAYAIGQVSEVLPTEFILCDDPFPEILTFKTREDLQSILPIVEHAYKPYLKYLEFQQD